MYFSFCLRLINSTSMIKHSHQAFIVENLNCEGNPASENRSFKSTKTVLSYHFQIVLSTVCLIAREFFKTFFWILTWGGGGVSESMEGWGCAILALELVPKNLIFA